MLTIPKIFTEEEKKEIVKSYTNKISTVKLSKIYHTSPKKIKKVLLENGIDIHDPNNTVGFPRKNKDWWRNKEHIIDAMRKCKNSHDFSTKYTLAYRISKEEGWYNELCELVFHSKEKFNNFYEKIHLIYSYEFKTLNYAYVGRTLDIKRRDKSHRYDEKDGVYQFSIRNSIEIPKIKILEEKLNAEESQIKEDEWLNYYINNGWNVINKASTGLNKSSLGASFRKWNYETCKDAASKCSSKEDFRRQFVGAYNISRKYGWIYDFFDFNLKKENGCFDTFEKCIDEIKKFNTIGEIRKEYPFLYHKICKNKWNNKTREILVNKQ